MESIDNCGHSGKFDIAMDVAASEFFVGKENAYDLNYKAA